MAATSATWTFPNKKMRKWMFSSKKLRKWWPLSADWTFPSKKMTTWRPVLSTGRFPPKRRENGRFLPKSWENGGPFLPTGHLPFPSKKLQNGGYFCRLAISLQKDKKMDVSLQKDDWKSGTSADWPFPSKKLQNGVHFCQQAVSLQKLQNGGHFCRLAVSLQKDEKMDVSLQKDDWKSGTSADWPFPSKQWQNDSRLCWLAVPSKRWWHLSPFAICATVSCSQTLSNCICISLI